MYRICVKQLLISENMEHACWLRKNMLQKQISHKKAIAHLEQLIIFEPYQRP